MYSFQLTKNIIGIDIGTSSLKIAECQRAGERITLLNYEIIRLPEGRGPNRALSLQETSTFIRDTLKELGIRTSDVVSEVTGLRTIARHLFMQDLADDEMREAIRWGAKADFPFALEEAFIDFYKLEVFKREEGEPEAEIIAAVATREVVEEQVALLKDSGLKPLFLSIPSFSLMQAYRFTQPSPWSETAAVIDLGQKSTRIIVLKEGKLKFSREIAVAGDIFTQSLIGSYEVNGQAKEIDQATAEKIKIKVGLLAEGEADQTVEGIPLDQVQKRLGSVMDRLLLEVERSINYYKNQFKDYEIERVFITGGGSLLKGLAEALEKNLEIPVQLFSNAGSLTVKKKINQDLFLKDLPFLTTLLGLVTQIQPFVNLSRQFLAPQVTKSSFGKYLKPALISLLTLGVIFFFGSQYWTASRQAAQFRKEVSVKKEQMARIGKPAEELARLEKEEAQLNKDLEGFPKIEIKKLPMQNLFQELFGLVPNNITLTQFEFSKAQETPVMPGPASDNAKIEPGAGKTEEVQKAVSSGSGGGKREYQLIIQGIAFGSDQEILAALSEFTRNLNRSAYYKEAKVQTTLKSIGYSKGAAEFKILAKLGEGVSMPLGVSS
ncbi:MAG: type IV pilus assembly protein PilM [Thermodesulfobacteriota bacterium]